MWQWLLRNAGWVFFLTLLAWAAFAIGFDVAVFCTDGVRFTISWQVQTFARRNPVAPFLCCIPIGLLLVHFFKVREMAWFDPEQPIHAALLGLFVGGLGGLLWWTQRG